MMTHADGISRGLISESDMVEELTYVPEQGIIKPWPIDSRLMIMVAAWNWLHITREERHRTTRRRETGFKVKHDVQQKRIVQLDGHVRRCAKCNKTLRGG
jgi:hypothetical protein